MLLDCLLGRGTDGRYLQMRQRRWINLALRHALEQRFRTIDASENQPIVGCKVAQGVVERFVRRRLADLDEGNLDDLTAKLLQRRRQRARLLLRARHQHTASGKWLVGLRHRKGASSGAKAQCLVAL